jgi:hypothetical protein
LVVSEEAPDGTSHFRTPEAGDLPEGRPRPSGRRHRRRPGLSPETVRKLIARFGKASATGITTGYPITWCPGESIGAGWPLNRQKASEIKAANIQGLLEPERRDRSWTADEGKLNSGISPA